MEAFDTVCASKGDQRHCRRDGKEHERIDRNRDRKHRQTAGYHLQRRSAANDGSDSFLCRSRAHARRQERRRIHGELHLIYTSRTNRCLRTSRTMELPVDDGCMEVHSGDCCWQHNSFETKRHNASLNCFDCKNCGRSFASRRIERDLR